MCAGGTPDTEELRKILDAMLLTTSWQEQLIYQALDTIRSPADPGCDEPPIARKISKKRKRK